MNHPAVTIGPTAIAVPEHPLSQEAVKDAMGELLATLQPERRAAVLSLFDSSGVRQRHSVLPLRALGQRRDISETMEVYREHAIRLGHKVAAECLERAGVAPDQIDLVITVSCTGFMIPSLDAHLANLMGLRSDVRRLPITQLGCTAGAAALVLAHDFLVGRPGGRVLIVSVELPTLSFQSRDISTANLVSTALFGDGAAATLVSGSDGPGAQVLATRSHIVADSIEALGFDLKNDGFHVVLARELPDLLRVGLGKPVRALLAQAGVSRDMVQSFVLHPGGPRVLHAVEEALQVGRQETSSSWNVLRDHGNLSSAAVYFVLHDWLSAGGAQPGTHTLLGAFGPGLSSELVLLRWN